MPPKTRPRLALLIDAENVSAAHARWIVDTARQTGEAIVRRAFGNWAAPSLAPWAKVIPDLGISAVQHVPATAGKNGADIALVIAAMDLMHAARLDGMVIASSDSDFAGLACRLREQGLLVLGLGEAKTPIAFRAACTLFKELPAAPKAAAPAPAKPIAPHMPVQMPLEQMLTQAVKSGRGADGWCHLGQLGQAIRKLKPDFRSKDHGHAQLTKLLRTIPEFDVAPGLNGGARVRLRTPGTSAAVQPDLCANAP